MSRGRFYGFASGLLLAVVAGRQVASTTPDAAAPLALTIREERERVVLAWSGPIVKPMGDELAAALERFQADRRRLVVALNSPGGSVSHGFEVMAAFREGARGREIDTLVERDGVCASMCVSIYLLGARRAADPGAHFMFHEAKIPPSPQASPTAESLLDARLRKAIEKGATDLIYDSVRNAPRVNLRWLAGLRAEIVGRDVWVSAQRLLDEGSGVVDALTPPPPGPR